MPVAEFPERRFPPPWSVEELDAMLCQIESRIKKTPVFEAGVFLYANKSGAGGVGGMGGKRPICGYLGPATILNLYRIAHSKSTVDKWDNSPSAKLSARGALLRISPNCRSCYRARRDAFGRDPAGR